MQNSPKVELIGQCAFAKFLARFLATLLSPQLAPTPDDPCALCIVVVAT